MSAIRKGDEPKVIGLIAAIVLVFGVAAFRVLGSSGPAPAPVASVSNDPVLAIISPPASPQAAVDSKDQDIMVPPMFAAASVDPFRTVVAKVSANPAPAKEPPHPRPEPDFPRMPMLRGTLTPLPMATAPIPPPEVPLHVSGLMPGPNGVAVVTVGPNTFVVKQGEKFGDGLKLLKVEKDGVQIERAGKTTRIAVDQ